MAQPAALTLLDLCLDVKQSLKSTFTNSFLLIAEIAECKENYSGHCYLELVQKEGEGDQIIARAKAAIWKSSYRMIKPYFFSVTGNYLCAGMKILVTAQIDFHELYGFNIIIKDIDPNYTKGDLSRQRDETILKLKEDGVFDMNRSLALPEVVQRIAVISSENAAGYEDFLDQLLQNEYDYSFNVTLYQSIMQGSEAPASITQALDAIHNDIDHYDAVVIIRGGGAVADLNCFDQYWLASNVAQFPLPIITGIGHEKDDSVTDLVAHTRLKTPTSVADFLIQKSLRFESFIDESFSGLIDFCRDIMLKKNYAVHTFAGKLNTLAVNRINFQHQYLIKKTGQIFSNSQQLLLKKNFKLELAEGFIKANDPEKLLKKGFVIPVLNNRKVDIHSVSLQDVLEFQFYQGRIFAKVEKIIPDASNL